MNHAEQAVHVFLDEHRPSFNHYYENFKQVRANGECGSLGLVGLEQLVVHGEKLIESVGEKLNVNFDLIVNLIN